jgi:phenylpyruvate tautomerase PptA (4-oxalocrotonate tautomerase family)
VPHIQIRLPHGTLDADGRLALARRLTTDVLLAEGLTDTPQQRSLCAISFDEIAPGAWTVGGEPAEPQPELNGFVRVTTLAGRLTDEHRSAVHRAVNDAVVDAVGSDRLGGLGSGSSSRGADRSWGAGAHDPCGGAPRLVPLPSRAPGCDTAPVLTSSDEIRNLLGRYCEAVDRGDWVAVGELFAHGCLATEDGAELLGGLTRRRLLPQRHAAPRRLAPHQAIVTNTVLR